MNTDNTEVTVNLTNVSNAQQISVVLNGVNDGTSVGDVPLTLGILVGDVNGNGVVSNSDVASVKAQVAAPVSSSNFRNDISVNGIISNTDVSAVKAQAGTTLP